MAEVICDTSPIQYLHQVGQLHLLPRLVTRITVPPAVASEIEAGRRIGIRHVAHALRIRIKGTLGVLLEAKSAGLIPAVKPILDQLEESGFRLGRATRTAVLELAGEASRI